MSGALAGFAAKKLLKESAENRFGQEDPYFESVPAKNLLGRPTTKKRKRAIPEGLSEHDAKVLTKVKRRAYRLDLSLCNFCGVRFGWGSVIALFPAFGDGIDALLALMVIASANKIEGSLPANLRIHMLFNVFLDFIIGLIPFVGDFADALYKCNTRNAVLLEKYLKERGKKNLKRADKSAGRSDTDPALGSNNGGLAEGYPREGSPARPQPAMVSGGKGSKRREPDIEMGVIPAGT